MPIKFIYLIMHDNGAETLRCGNTNDDFDKFRCEDGLVVFLREDEEIGSKCTIPADLEDASKWAFIADFYCLHEGGSLRYNRRLASFLEDYFMSYDQSLIACFLTRLGYRSKAGLQLTNSHISNFLRKDLGLRKQRYASKPFYQGRNWITG